MAQFVNNIPTANQQIDIDEFIKRMPWDQAAISHGRQAWVKVIVNTLPDYDPGDENSISVNQFIDRVNTVVDAYQWDENFVLLDIYTSQILDTTSSIPREFRIRVGRGRNSF